MDLMFASWQLPYFTAISENSEEHLRERVDDAERAILIRLEELSRTPGRDMERHAIQQALDTLHIIKKSKLDFPHPGQGAISLL
jgi:hypothetical protein